MKNLIALFIIGLLILSFPASAQTQCKGIKKDNTQCKITVKEGSYCRWHNPNANYCTATKKDGKRCRMIVKEGVLFCQFHAKG